MLTEGGLDKVERGILLAGLRVEVERLRDRGHDQRGVGEGGQGDEPHAVGEVVGDLSGHFHGEAGLADSARSDEGDEANVVAQQLIGYLLHVALAAQDTSGLRGKIMQARGLGSLL